MANLVCGFNDIIEKINNIKKILRKYTALAQGLGSLGPVTVATEALNKYVTEFFSSITSTEGYKSLYGDLNKIYQYVDKGFEIALEGADALKTGSEKLKQFREDINELVADYGEVVSNLAGIMQDIQDLTIVDIQILELDLARLGLNPGDVVSRITNGEDPKVVLGDARSSLSLQSQALIDKLKNPISVDFDAACKKIPNVAIITVGNVRTPIVLPNPPKRINNAVQDPPKAPVIETESDKSSVPARVQNDPVQVDQTPAYKTLKAIPIDSKYNFKSLTKPSKEGGVAPFSDNFNKFASITYPELVKRGVTLNQTAVANAIELNLNIIGSLLIKPLKAKYGKSIMITSGWRAEVKIDPKQNKNKKSISPHAKGQAFDFQMLDASIWKSDDDNPMQFLKKIMREQHITVDGKKVGWFQLLVEKPQGVPLSAKRQWVLHVGAVYVPGMGNHLYNGNKVYINDSVPKK